MQSYSNEQDVSKDTESGVGRCTADREAKVAPGVCLFLAGPTTASSVMEEPAHHIKVSALASAVGGSGTEKWEKPGSLGERRSYC